MLSLKKHRDNFTFTLYLTIIFLKFSVQIFLLEYLRFPGYVTFLFKILTFTVCEREFSISCNFGLGRIFNKKSRVTSLKW